MARNLTNQVRAISGVARAVATGDISETVNIQVEGEMLELKDAVNTMVLQLSNFSLEVSRVTGEIGTKGVLGGQAVVPGVQGAWEELRNDVNVSPRASFLVSLLTGLDQTMAHNLTKQVRAISEVARAVALGDISQTVDVHVEGEMLELKQSVNTMVLQLGAFSSSVMHVALEVGTKGVLGGQAVVPGVHGTWADLTESFNVNVACCRAHGGR
jgi:HAMP domain-containing protein